MGLEITTGNAGEIPLFVLSGELDIYTVPRFRQLVEEAPRGTSRIALDLCGVTLVDSSGLGALLRLSQMDGGGRPVILVCQGSSIPQLLELTKLADRFIVVGSIDDLAASFDATAERTGSG